VPDTSETLGVISDTHGLLRPEAIEALRGCAQIIHAGDVGSAHILDQLRSIAPTVAVKGNVDTEPWAAALPQSRVIEFDGHSIYMIHIIGQMNLPPPPNISVVVFGHSHQPSIEDRNGVLFLNPGSAGPRRFKLPISVGYLAVESGKLRARILELEVDR